MSLITTTSVLGRAASFLQPAFVTPPLPVVVVPGGSMTDSPATGPSMSGLGAATVAGPAMTDASTGSPGMTGGGS